MIGSKLAHYEIREELGRGGMGVVYKARDTHLDRFVAIKVLPAEAVANPERKRRFVQEAKSASALNHPNIVTIFDISSDNGTDFIAMEYVAGKPLDELIPRRGMPLGELLKIGVQVADALTAAHAAGIVHRDLKPANIIVGEDGRVRVLDFGLAKLTDLSDSSELDETKTVAVADSSPQTEEGTILGTTYYMSPEQAEGRRVDARSDIFSFGAMLYEMVTGRRPFRGDSNMATLAAIINKDPEELPADVPFELKRLIERCLRKDSDRRIQHMGDIRLALEDLREEATSGKLESPVVASRSSSGRRLFPLTLIAAATVVTVGLTGWMYWDGSEKGVPAPRFEPIPLTSDLGFEYNPTFSPEGDRVAYCWVRDGRADIWVRLIGTDTKRQLTDSGLDQEPLWSPDGTQIAFLRRIREDAFALIVMPSIGGSGRTLGEIPITGRIPIYRRFIAWHPSGQSLAVIDKGKTDDLYGISLVNVQSGKKHRLTSPTDTTIGDGSVAFSPDGRTLLFGRGRGAGGYLYSQALDEQLQPVGEPVRLTTQAFYLGYPIWLPDDKNILCLFGRGEVDRTVGVMPNSGGELRTLPFQRRLASLAYNSVTNRLAYSVLQNNNDVWRATLSAPGVIEGAPAKFIASTKGDGSARYSPDGSRIAFNSSRSGQAALWLSDSDGKNPIRLTSVPPNAHRWSPDGAHHSFGTNVDGNRDIHVVSSSGGEPHRLTQHPALDTGAAWTPDGRWMYFQSDRTGRMECWKMPAEGGEAVQFTEDGGISCFPSPDGEFLYYSKLQEQTSLWRRRFDSLEEEMVLPSIFRDDQFVVRSEGIYFISGSYDREHFSIRFLDFETGETKLVTELSARPGFGLSVSPDGTHVLWSQLAEYGADIMLVENFR